MDFVEIQEITSPRYIPNYNEMVDDLRSIIVESETASRMTLIEGYHQLGKQIMYYGLDKPDYITQLASDLKKSKRSIYRVIQFVKMYPLLERLPEGKNTSWHVICNKYLVGKSEQVESYEVTHEDILEYLTQNIQYLAEKANITKKGVTIQITKDQIERYKENKNVVKG